MDFKFTEEHNMLRAMVRKFVDQDVKPLAAKIDKEKAIPEELLKKAAGLGLMGIPFPEEYGGSEQGEIGACIMLEELGHGCASTAVTISAHQSLASTSIYVDGTNEQKEKYLVPLAKGEKLGAFALTEPQAGSDAAAIKTSAVRDRDDFVINGNKIWITNGSNADIIVVYAVTDPEKGAHGGVSAFIVESSTPGFKVGTIEEKMGIRGSTTAELIFEDMKVPMDNMLGVYGAGFITAMKALDIGRLSLGAAALGASKELLDLSLKFAKERKQFNVPICEHQAVQFMLADMSTKIYAMEGMVYRTANMVDNGEKFTRESAIVKIFCSEALDWIVDTALQIHGGLGYMSHYPVERFYRDSRINRIFEGTNEIQKIVIAKELIKKGTY